MELLGFRMVVESGERLLWISLKKEQVKLVCWFASHGHDAHRLLQGISVCEVGCESRKRQ